MKADGRGRWLVVGHGSVGSVIARRLSAIGVEPHIFDPAPRVDVVSGVRIDAPEATGPAYDVIVSCVTPSSALDVPLRTATATGPDSLLLDWNTVPPDVKEAIAVRTPASVVDVALLDTLDEDSARPSLATSGPRAGSAHPVLERLGFDVAVVGTRCGDAARLKLARSLFMKTLEALVVEFEASIATLPGGDVVRASIERNLGETYSAFAELLLRTDRLHAQRRFRELESAVEVYRAGGKPVRLAEAAAGVLRSAADAWARPDAPPAGSQPRELATFLGHWLEGRS